MTVENGGITRKRTGSRARRNSVVQRIAVRIPREAEGAHHYIEDHEEHAPVLKRCLSSETLKPHTTTTDDLLFPFDSKEKEALISKYINNTFDYNVLPTAEEQDLIESQQILKYTRFLETCRFRKNVYTELMDHSDKIINELTDLTVKYDTVTKETFEFQSQSDALIGEYNSFIELNDQLKQNLAYYEQLDVFTRKLNNPSPNIVRRDSFKKMLGQLDECIAFMEAHKDHKEHEIFLLRFKQCLTRALTLIRNYIVNNIKTIRDTITEKLGGNSSITEDALIYTRFASDAEFLKDVAIELCSRVDDESFEGLLNDCFHVYFGIRYRFLQPRITEHLRHALDKKRSLVQLAQTSISYFSKIFKDEYELFHKIFPIDHQDALTNWFQQLSEPLYDFLRNQILREQSLNSLCELASLLDKYYEYDEDELEEAREGVEYGVIFEPILQDVQSRLVFRAQWFVDEKIVKYRPTTKDFQIGHRRKSQPMGPVSSEGVMDDEASLILTANTKTSQDWYPPLNKGVALLSKIYQLVSSSVFDDLAHNIVHDCIISLREAYAFSKASISPLESDLFFLKNLLMLKDQVQNFDIEYVSSETFLDFSGVGDILNKIRNGEGVFNEKGGIIGLVRESVPKVVRNMIDARMELQTELRNVVHAFTEDCMKQIVEPLTTSTVETADKDVEKLQANLEEYLPRIKDQIQLFIDDPQVVTTLIDGVQEVVIQSYENYFSTVGHQVKNSVHVVEVDTMIAFIGQIVAKMFEEDDQPQLQTPVDQMAELTLGSSSPTKERLQTP